MLSVHSRGCRLQYRAALPEANLVEWYVVKLKSSNFDYMIVVAGWLMISLIALSLFSILVLLSPPQPVVLVLELMPLPWAARGTLLFAAAINVALSVSFERWCAQVMAQLIGGLFLLRCGRWRGREGKAYKVVEGGMR